MASSAPNKAFIGRASAVLTTGEVAGNSFVLNNAWGSQVTVDLSFTIGSLTNVTVRFYASTDDSTFDPIYTSAGAEMTEVLTGDAERCYTVPNLSGWRFFRVSVQGSGTVTSSLCDFTYRYLKRGSQ
jgi:hypothetical protein